MAKSKAKAPKSVAAKDLEAEPKDVKDVKGGLVARKAGGTQQEYLQVELENVQITSYQLG